MTHIFRQNSILLRFLFAAVSLLLLGFQPRGADAQLIVNIRTISTEGDSLHGLKPAFPNPVFTFVSVRDTAGNVVRELAHTSRFLGPDELAENGRPIRDIWQPVFEYPPNGPIRPPDSDLYAQRPAVKFTEITENDLIPTSTMLLMDVSGSIENNSDIPGALDTVKIGLKRFVSGMRPVDRAGIIRFACDIDTLEFTNDTNLLEAFINSTNDTGPWTALYQSLLSAIDLIEGEDTKLRSIVVYTDGQESLPRDPSVCPEHTITKADKVTERAVIEKAQQHHIPIFTIALGKRAREDILRNLAGSTGGHFFRTTDGSGFGDFYAKISKIVHNFYVMAHTAPEPCGFDSTRIVDMTVNDFSGTTSDTARYAFLGPPKRYDLKLTTGTDKNSVRPGAQINYTVNLENPTPTTAFNLTLRDSLPDFMTVADTAFSQPPDHIEGHFLIWRFDSLSQSQTMTITYTAQVDATLPDSVTEFIKTSELLADCDIDLSNNFASDAVVVKLPECDLTLTKNATAETVKPGGHFRYALTIANQGIDTARNITLVDTIPDFVSITHFSQPPDSSFPGNKSFFWTLAALAPRQDTTITFDVEVDAGLSDTMLVNTSRVAAECDQDVTNNFASATVLVTPELTDITVFKTARTAAFTVPESDTLWFVKAGETYSYRIKVSNLENVAAKNVIVKDIIPPSVQIENFAAGDTMQLSLGNLPPNTDATLAFQATVLINAPPDTIEITNTVTVQADNEDPDKLLDNISTSSVFLVGKPVTEGCDLFYLDFNVFEPDKGEPLGISFDLTSSRTVRLDVYDISGYHVQKLVEDTFDFGTNRYEWDGMTSNNQKIGSGVYVITLRSAGLVCWKKVIIAR